MNAPKGERLKSFLGVRIMANTGTRTAHILEDVGREIKDNPPSILEKTRRKKGVERAEAQRVAILLSKARKSGAIVPNQE